MKNKKNIINKIKKDYFYSKMLDKGYSLNQIEKAGFFDDKKDVIDYMLDFITTPVNKLKIKSGCKNYILLNTGSYSPIHCGHINLLKSAKKEIESKGLHVAGAYLSPSHDKYVSSKYDGSAAKNCLERISHINQEIEYSDFIMVDPWESVFVDNPINFTDVVKRTELYLQKHLNADITVIYVYGSDNYEFGFPFWDRFSVCVERDSRQVLNNQNNILYISENEYRSETSSKIRQVKGETIELTKSGIYLIRDDTSYLNYFNIDFSHFKISFFNELKKSVPIGVKIKYIDVVEQLSQKLDILGKTVSLDKYYKGDYNLNISRIFDISEFQKKCIDFHCLGEIPDNTVVTIIDDDIISGSTIKYVEDKYHLKTAKKIALNLQYFEADSLYDIVDIRDFILGFPSGGLFVKNVNNEMLRVPYIYPFVNLETRAKIYPKKQMEFSKKILELNYQIYKDTDIKVCMIDQNMSNFLKYLGFDDNELMANVCKKILKRFYL